MNIEKFINSYEYVGENIIVNDLFVVYDVQEIRNEEDFVFFVQENENIAINIRKSDIKNLELI